MEGLTGVGCARRVRDAAHRVNSSINRREAGKLCSTGRPGAGKRRGKPGLDREKNAGMLIIPWKSAGPRTAWWRPRRGQNVVTCLPFRSPLFTLFITHAGQDSACRIAGPAPAAGRGGCAGESSARHHGARMGPRGRLLAALQALPSGTHGVD